MFEDKSAKIMVVEATGSVRQMLTQIIKEFGFANTTGVPSIKEVVAQIEVETVDWIITSLFDGSEWNGINLLKLMSDQPALKNIKCTLLLSLEEKDVILSAYELGMLSHILKPFNKESISKQIDEFYNFFSGVHWNTCLLAAHYLREFLNSEKKFEAQVDLEKSLLACFPGDMEVLFNLAEAQFRLNLLGKAKASFKQIVMINPEKEEEVIKRAKELFGEEDFNLDDVENNDDGHNALGLDVVVVVDSDDASQKAVVESLKNLGVAKVEAFDDGKLAWEWVEAEEKVDLIVMEWRIPSLTGPLLIQRLRKKHASVPIITISSLIKPKDQPILLEMGVAMVVEKPFQREDLVKRIVTVIQEERLPSTDHGFEDKIRRLIVNKRYHDALLLREKYTKNIKLPPIIQQKVDAYFAYAEKNYEKACSIAFEVCKKERDSIIMLNFLGKCFMSLNDYVSALKCFEKAQSVSPMNIQRLCMMADINYELGNKENSQTNIDKAKEIDGENKHVSETEASLKIASGEFKAAKDALESLETLDNVISYMNNKAVACSRSGRYNDGIQIYKKTLASIPNKRMEQKAVVTYNLALAYARTEQLKQAAKFLQEAQAYGKTRVLQKCKALEKRVGVALKTGGQFKLNEAGPGVAATENKGEETDAEKKHKEIINTLEARPGESACLRVFYTPETKKERIRTLLAKPIHFNVRKAMERDATSGLEKTMKS